MGSRKLEKEALLAWHLDRVLEPLHFRRGEPLPLNARADRMWWFFRDGSRFKTEAVAALVQWRKPSVLVLSCYASPFSADDLRARGLGGTTAIGQDIYVYLVHVLERDQDHVLPDMIPLGTPDTWPTLFERIAGELEAVDQGMWDYLWDGWQARSR